MRGEKISKQILMEDDGSLFQLGDAQGEWELRESDCQLSASCARRGSRSGTDRSGCGK